MAQYLPRALSPGQWISIENYALLADFQFVPAKLYDALQERAAYIIQLKAPACQFFSDCVWLITQQIGIEHAYPVLIELKKEKVTTACGHRDILPTLPQRLN
jgi:hypothetical protein